MPIAAQASAITRPKDAVIISVSHLSSAAKAVTVVVLYWWPEAVPDGRQSP